MVCCFLYWLCLLCSADGLNFLFIVFHLLSVDNRTELQVLHDTFSHTSLKCLCFPTEGAMYVEDLATSAIFHYGPADVDCILSVLNLQ